MNIETKTVTGHVGEYLKFGWTHTEDKDVRYGRSGHRVDRILARDKDMPNYRLIAALETKYFALKAQKKKYEPMEPIWCVLLFLLFVIPFVLYALFKHVQKKDFEENNEKLQKEMDDILKEVKPLLQ